MIARALPRMRNIRIPGRPALAVLASAALFLAACGGNEAPGGGGPGGDVTVTTALVAEQPWSDTIDALGTVALRENSEDTRT